ncbi:uncharacterized mitochondrial protein AtMg00810-like [Penaeus chinensis]|uniref:uncharacterized mitochondrial protein AtMg00810-like n=1 Tax=Penaeus chinensis TaxID=139456 RepID=UPI001FB5CE67|nr:uncharacterized mitochondrial protein AtMg00810-like [Penaeus chinensis]
MSLMDKCKKSLCQKFRMTDLGKLNWFLGMSFVTGKDYIEVNQTKYVEKILDRFNMSDCYARNIPCDPSIVNTSTVESNELINATLYREVVGSLIYIMTGTRPDLCYVVSKLSQYMSKPTKAQLNSAKQVLKYLKGTMTYGLTFRKSNESIQLKGFCDSDWGSSEDRKSISGYCFQLHRDGPLISWRSKKQQTVALSSCEAEYMALTYAIQEAKFLRQTVSDLDEVEKGNVKLFYVPTQQNPADIFTKPVNQKKEDEFFCHINKKGRDGLTINKKTFSMVFLKNAEAPSCRVFIEREQIMQGKFDNQQSNVEKARSYRNVVPEKGAKDTFY